MEDNRSGSKRYHSESANIFQEDTIFVSGITPVTSVDEIKAFFGAVADIKIYPKSGKPMIRLFYNKNTGMRNGLASITFVDSHAARSAIECLDNQKFNGATIKVKLDRLPKLKGRPKGIGGRRDSDGQIEAPGRSDLSGGSGSKRYHSESANVFQEDTVFVSGITPATSVDEIKAFFGAIGDIKIYPKSEKPMIRLFYNKNTGMRNGLASVTFVDSHAARSAIECLDREMLNGSTIKVQLYKLLNEERRGGRDIGTGGGRVGGEQIEAYGGSTFSGDEEFNGATIKVRLDKSPKRKESGGRDGGGLVEAYGRSTISGGTGSKGHHKKSGYIVHEDTVFISGITPGTSENEMKAFFGAVADIKMDQKSGEPMISIFYDKSSGMRNGLATVTYVDSNAARFAIECLNNKKLNGATIKMRLDRLPKGKGREGGPKGIGRGRDGGGQIEAFGQGTLSGGRCCAKYGDCGSQGEGGSGCTGFGHGRSGQINN